MDKLLVEAARRGALDDVERLLLVAGGANNDRGGVGALRAASVGGHLHVVQRLLQVERLQETDGRARDAVNDVVLSTASHRGHLHIVEWMLSADGGAANVHIDHDHALRFASQTGHLQVVERLLEAGANVHACNDQALRWAASNGHSAVVARLLAAGADVHAFGEEALRQASANGHADAVAVLLACGANVRVSNDLALRSACENGHLAVVEHLLNAGADMHAEEPMINQYDTRPLALASQHGHLHVVERLLAAGTDPNGYYFQVPWKRVVLSVPPSTMHRLPDGVRLLWLRLRVRVRPRLVRALERARARLDRPPTEPLGPGIPTRETLTAHLKTGGRRFAREYWTEGLPIFFPGLKLGPVPPCFSEAWHSLNSLCIFRVSAY